MTTDPTPTGDPLTTIHAVPPPAPWRGPLALVLALLLVQHVRSILTQPDDALAWLMVFAELCGLLSVSVSDLDDDLVDATPFPQEPPV